MEETNNKWSPTMMTKMRLDAVAVLQHNSYMPLAMRVWPHEKAEDDDGFVCFVDNAPSSSDAYFSIWSIAHKNKLRIIEIEYDKWETNDPNRPRIDCIWIKYDDLEAFRSVFGGQRTTLAAA